LAIILHFLSHLLTRISAEYTSTQTVKRNTYRRKIKELGGNLKDVANKTNGTASDPANVEDGDSPPASKRARKSDGDAANGAGGSQEDGDDVGDETLDAQLEEMEEEQEEEEEEEEEQDEEEEEEVEDEELDEVDEQLANEMRENRNEPPDDEALDNGEDSDA
jgi:DNA polymerase epsilon subunit 3